MYMCSVCVGGGRGWECMCACVGKHNYDCSNLKRVLHARKEGSLYSN